MIIVKTYRGHIRNWEELCERLGIDLTLSREEREHEILIKAYQTWGCEMADHMHGMFAFALWDEEEQKLFCLRDQFGTKPFYYYETEDGELLYGTMIRDIIDRPGFKKELNEEMLQLYLSLTYVAGENTFFRGLKKLLPGRYLIWQDGKLEIHRYWKPEFHPDESKTLEDWADEIHNTLKEIMPEVKTADEKVESFLSGGVDSSYVLAMSDAEQADSCGYEEERFDESVLAEKTAQLLGRTFSRSIITLKNIVVHSEDVRGALLECLVKITTAIKETLERTPPELSADIIDRGITLTGGGALLRGLDQLIQSETGIDVHIADDPLDCVAKGAGAVLDHVDVLHDVLDTDGGHM